MRAQGTVSEVQDDENDEVGDMEKIGGLPRISDEDLSVLREISSTNSKLESCSHDAGSIGRLLELRYIDGALWHETTALGESYLIEEREQRAQRVETLRWNDMPLVVSCAALVVAIAAIGGSSNPAFMPAACVLSCLLLGMALGESVRCRAEAKAIRECADDGKGKIANSSVCENARPGLCISILIAIASFLVGLFVGVACKETCIMILAIASVALLVFGFLLGFHLSTRGLGNCKK